MKLRTIHILVFTIATLACVSGLYAQDSSFGEYENVDNERDGLDREKILYSPGGEGEVRYLPRNATGHGGSTTPSTNTTPKDNSKESSKEPEIKMTNPAPVKLKTEGQQKSAEKPVTAAPKANGEGEILSFNFLYYIIQKYKLQDIID